MKNKMYAAQTNLCIQPSYLEDQRNLKIYNKKKKKYVRVCVSSLTILAGKAITWTHLFSHRVHACINKRGLNIFTNLDFILDDEKVLTLSMEYKTTPKEKRTQP